MLPGDQAGLRTEVGAVVAGTKNNIGRIAFPDARPTFILLLSGTASFRAVFASLRYEQPMELPQFRHL